MNPQQLADALVAAGLLRPNDALTGRIRSEPTINTALRLALTLNRSQVSAALGVPIGDLVDAAYGSVDPFGGQTTNPVTGQTQPAGGGGSDLGSQISAAIAGIAEDDEDTRPPLLGIPNDMPVVIPRSTIGDTDIQGPAIGVQNLLTTQAGTMNDAGYRDGDQYTLFSGLTPEQKAAIQSDMVAAGLLGDGDYSPGVWDIPTIRASRDLLIAANGSNRTWGAMLRDLVNNPPPDLAETGPTRRGFVKAAYIQPDYATLAQRVKNEFATALGRRPEDWEVTLLADQLRVGARAAYEAQESARRLEFEAGNRAIDGADQTSGTVQGVDPVARFQEAFEERYRPEMERQEDIAATARNRNLILQTALLGDRNTGGIL